MTDQPYTVSLTAEDGVVLAADVYQPEAAPTKWFVFVHMMPERKESWRLLAQKALERGYASVAVDLRGHGQSTDGPDGFLKFKDVDHQRSSLDVKAAVACAREHGATSDQLVLVGASIGANLALQHIVNYPECKKAIALSAGLEYRGIETKPLASRVRADQTVLFISARDDERSGGNNAAMNEEIVATIAPEVRKEIIILEKGGHGTDILKTIEGSKLMEKILEF